MSGASEKQADDAASGTWLFKEGGIVKGPVTAAVLVEQIELGALEEATPIAREVGQWVPMGDVPFFKEKLDDRRRRQRRQDRASRNRAVQRNAAVIRAIILCMLFAVSFAAAYTGARYAQQTLKNREHQAWLDLAPPLLDLPPPPPPPKPEPKPPQAESTTSEPPPSTAHTSSADNKRAGAHRPTKRRSSGRVTRETLSDNDVLAGMKKGRAGIFRCIQVESKRNPHMPPVVTAEFVISNDGTAIQFKLQEREVRNGPLAPCIAKVLKGVRWPRFYGERKNVIFPFRIRK